MGITDGSRLGIFARRAAPVQVSYLGYPATLGAPYMDYLLADAVVIPPELQSGYSKQVLRLPYCFLLNDERRPLAPQPTRTAAGLPEQGLVFCAFTQARKLNPPMFEVWMRLLRQVDGSVLWLRDMGVKVRQNLAREARFRGIASERLIYAPRIASTAEHLGRQGLADLYLDTLPYNAHSTACDALWAGVPVLTCAGRSFAARVAASALRAVGLRAACPRARTPADGAAGTAAAAGRAACGLAAVRHFRLHAPSRGGVPRDTCAGGAWRAPVVLQRRSGESVGRCHTFVSHGRHETDIRLR
jgi:predicted O-linked N-acetylglucosamine transferase (SPINDLY family)